MLLSLTGPRLLLGLASAMPIAPRSPLALLRRGMPRAAVSAASDRLAVDPDHADAMAWLGAAWSAAGQPADAVGAFDLCVGSGWYETGGIDAHADALRAFASPEAAALHTERLRTGTLSTGQRILLTVDLIDDHRARGEVQAALDAAAEGTAAAPRSPALMAAEADIHVDLGDLDTAEVLVAHSLALGPTLRAHLVAGRIALLRDDPQAALGWSEAARRFGNPTLRLQALRIEALRRTGGDAALDELLGTLRVRHSDHPAILAAKLRVHADRGERAALRALSARAAALYPDNAELRTTRRALGLLDPASAG